MGQYISSEEQGTFFAVDEPSRRRKDKESMDADFAYMASTGDLEGLRSLWRAYKSGWVELDPFGSDNRSFILACSAGHIEVVNFLLDEVLPESRRRLTNSRVCEALQLAAQNGHPRVVRSVLGSFGPAYFGVDGISKAFSNAAHGGCVASMSEIYAVAGDRYLDRTFVEDAIVRSAFEGKVDALIYMVESLGFDPSVNDNEAFRRAAAAGHLHVLEYLWDLKKARGIGIDPTAKDNEAFCHAAESGRLNVLEFLCRLEGVKIDPSASHEHLGRNYAFLRAAQNGHCRVLQFIASLETFDPKDVSLRSSIWLAAIRGCISTIVFLCDRLYDVFEPEDFKCAISHAVRGNHMDAVKYLWSVGQFDDREALILELFFLGTVHKNVDVLAWAKRVKDESKMAFFPDYTKGVAILRVEQAQNHELRRALQVLHFLRNMKLRGEMELDLRRVEDSIDKFEIHLARN